MRERYQGGSLAGFIIIGVLLMLVLAGGLYGLNRYNAQRADEQIAQNDESTPTSDETSTEDKTMTDAGSATTETQGRTGSESADTERAATDDATDENTELPQTGPTESFAGMIAVSVLTFAGVHLLRSRA